MVMRTSLISGDAEAEGYDVPCNLEISIIKSSFLHPLLLQTIGVDDILRNNKSDVTHVGLCSHIANSHQPSFQVVELVRVHLDKSHHVAQECMDYRV